MWIMNKDGFFSIVQHKDMPWMMMVRARVREDLVNAFGESKHIIEDEQADYRFRLMVHQNDVKNYMIEAVESIDYTTSVKDRIDQKDPDRHRALYKVWDAFYELQEKKYGPGRYSYTPISEPIPAKDAFFDPADPEYLAHGEPMVGEVKAAPPVAEDAVVIVIDDLSSLFDPSGDEYLT